MTTTLQQRSSANLWEQFCQWVTSTENRPLHWLVRRVDDPHFAGSNCLLRHCFRSLPPPSTSTASVSPWLAPRCTATTSSPVRLCPLLTLSVCTSTPSGKPLPWMSGCTTVAPTSSIIFHFLIGGFCYMGREWELSYRLGMRPWICVAYLCSRSSCHRSIPDLPPGSGLLL